MAGSERKGDGLMHSSTMTASVMSDEEVPEGRIWILNIMLAQSYDEAISGWRL
jgi:hypothetical protein